jgi:hypothetical protein
MSTDILPDPRTAQDHPQNLVHSRPWRIPPRTAQSATRIKASPYLPQRDRKPSYARVNRWRLRNPERQRALSAVRRALANYDLDRASCERCGTDRNVCADPVSVRPLRVVWRCRRCTNALRRERGNG